MLRHVLTHVLVHPGLPTAPHDVWTSWNPDPVIAATAVLVAWAYARGARRSSDHRGTAFAVGLGVTLVALLSPLHAVAGSLASAHMAQHMLLIVVAGPLLAWSRPLLTMERGTPQQWRRLIGRGRRRTRLTPRRVKRLLRPGLAWLAHAIAIWVWHSSVLYGATLQYELVHAAEHATFLLTAVWFWSVVLEGFWSRQRSLGMGILMLFAMAMQGVLLAVVMTFAGSPWYMGYTATVGTWGLTPLQDQQLAGLIMWIPSGLVYTGFALLLLVRWIGDTDPASPPGTGAGRSHPRGGHPLREPDPARHP